MINIKNSNCPFCGRLLELNNVVKDEIICSICECVSDITYDIIITEEGIETEVVLVKEKK